MRHEMHLFFLPVLSLQAVSNIGKHYSEIVPKGLDLVLDVATDEQATGVVRISALEVGTVIIKILT